MLSNFEISILKLKNGEHVYEFELKKDFFEAFEYEEIQDADLKAIVKLNKSSRLIMANFLIEGSVQLVCDRSLESFEENISTEEQTAYKYGETEEELSDDLFQITANTQSLNVARQLFEMTVFALPMKKLHPKFRKDDDGQDALVYSSSTSEANEANYDDDNNDVKDPRWSSLKQLKDKFQSPN
jgi:uncharacterized metal-binding protein YceD (DUF177 family)